MILLVLIEIALLCVLVLLIRIAIRRGVARVFKNDDDFGDEIEPPRKGNGVDESVSRNHLRAVSASEEKQ